MLRVRTCMRERISPSFSRGAGPLSCPRRRGWVGDSQTQTVTSTCTVYQPNALWTPETTSTRRAARVASCCTAYPTLETRKCGTPYSTSSSPWVRHAPTRRRMRGASSTILRFTTSGRPRFPIGVPLSHRMKRSVPDSQGHKTLCIRTHGVTFQFCRVRHEGK